MSGESIMLEMLNDCIESLIVYSMSNGTYHANNRHIQVYKLGWPQCWRIGMVKVV